MGEVDTLLKIFDECESATWQNFFRVVLIFQQDGEQLQRMSVLIGSRAASFAEDLVNLGPEGRIIKVSELSKGLLNFGGLYCALTIHGCKRGRLTFFKYLQR